MKKNIYVLLFLIMGTCANVWAQKTITGTVTDTSVNEPLIGATVLIKGTTVGVITDFDGKYTIQANQDDVLVFSYIGLDTQEIAVGDRSVINVDMKNDGVKIDEVVVTAMGIKRKSKSLTYATQRVGGNELTRAKETNMINSLQGKSAGVNITTSASGAGGSAKIVIRGNKSAQGNNQPLIVLDGMPMSNYSSSQGGDGFSDRDGGDALSNINPDDIASINVLKGASAAALYGSMASNGVILITTKKGREGKVRIDFSSSLTFDQISSYPNLQDTYGAVVNNDGSLSSQSWGEKLTDSDSKKGANRVDDFFQTGSTFINSVSLSGGTKNAQTFASYANTTSSGVVPNNEFSRHNMTLKESMLALDGKLHVDVSLNYIVQKVQNRPTSGMYYNPLAGLYRFPANGDFSAYKDNYSNFDSAKNYDVQNWYMDTNTHESNNPYWTINKNKTEEYRHRSVASGIVRYDILDNLNIQGRLSYDRSQDTYNRNSYASTSQTIVGANGAYDNRLYTHSQFYGDLMANYNTSFLTDFTVSASAGISFTNQETYTNSIRGDLVVPNIFAKQNIEKQKDGETASKEKLNSAFATAQFGYKDMLFLDVTGRNDWSSTLAYTNNESFFYPSVGLTAVISDMVEMPELINLFKVRGSYSIVGNGMPAYITHPMNTLKLGQVQFNTTSPFAEMEPEKMRSLEAGFDLSLLNNRINMDVTFYKTNNTNQYFSMSAPSGTGYSKYYFNAGNIQNMGIEASIDYSMMLGDNITWKTGANMSWNQNEIKKLDDRSGVLDEDRLDYAEIGNTNGMSMRLVEGGSYGDVYSKVFVRDADGVLVLDDDGAPTISSEYEKVGNVNPKWSVGWSNRFDYKNWQLYFLFNGSIGGDYLDVTQMSLDSWGVTQASATARDNGGIDAGDGTMIDAQTYYNKANSVASEYLNSATNFRMRELSLGYTFRNVFGVSKNLTINAVGRNLFFLYKDGDSDPEQITGTGNSSAGYNNMSVPSTRSFGVNVKATF